MTRHLYFGWCLYIFLAIVSLPATSVAMSYKGYHMFSVRTNTARQTQELLDLEDKITGVSTVVGETYNGVVMLVVPPEKVGEVKAKVKGQGLEITQASEDVQSLIDATTKRAAGPVVRKRAISGSDSGTLDHQEYHEYPKIVAMLKQLSQHNLDLMEIYKLPYRTHEGRDVTLVKLHGNSIGAALSAQPKPAVILEAGIHAREWISPAVHLWVIDTFVQGYRSSHKTIMEMLDVFDWFIIPVTNPDGYQFSHTEDRLWRKNRRYISLKCRGVDLNRNFNVAFNTTGVSQDCSDGRYPGHKPFSEPETSNVKELVEQLQHRLVAYISVHSYSQMLLVPWSYSETPSYPDNFEEIDRIASLMQAAIRIRHGTEYLRGQARQMIGYAASGASEDWALKVVPGIFSLCIELRPSAGDKRYFLLPPDEIVPTAEEYFDALVVMANELAKNREEK